MIRPHRRPIAAFTIAAALLGLAPPACAEVRIGVAAPLTGPDAVFGAQIRVGVEQAAADLNAAGGIRGERITVVPSDDGGDPKRGAAVAATFIGDGVSFVVGDFGSAVTVPASAAYAAAGIVAITPAATAPLVTERGLPTVFRLSGREDTQGEVAARYLLEHRPSRVAILNDRSAAGKALADGVRKALAAGAVRDVLYAGVDRGTRDMGALVDRLRASGAQVAFWGGAPTEAGLLVRQLREANLPVTLLGGTALAADEFTAAAGAAADGSLLVFPTDPRQRPEAVPLVKVLAAKGIVAETYAIYAYAAVQVIAQAAEATGSLQPGAVAAALHAGSRFATVLGPVAFDAKGDWTMPDYAVTRWHKGPAGRLEF